MGLRLPQGAQEGVAAIYTHTKKSSHSNSPRASLDDEINPSFRLRHLLPPPPPAAPQLPASLLQLLSQTSRRHSWYSPWGFACPAPPPQGTSCPSPPCFSLPPASSPSPPLASPTGMRRLQGKANSIRLMNRTWRPRARSQVGREVGQGLLRPSCPCPATPAQKEAKGPRKGQGWALTARL